MSKNKKNLIRILVCGCCFIPLLVTFLTLGEKMPFWGWLILFLAVYLVIAYDVLLRAGRNIAHGKVFDENFLMIVATAGAFAIGEYAEALAVMLFYQVGELFQSYAVGRSRRSIAALTELCPERACLVTDDGEKDVAPEDVEVGSLIVVRAGERVPIDGVVEEGEVYLDCSALTGESVPVKAGVGDAALSGAINTSGVVKLRTQKAYADSTVSKIIELVENATAKKAKAENFITRFAAVYTPAVVACAVLLAVLPPLIINMNSGAVWTDWLERALSFLVVSCPCALVISVPMSFFGGIGAASKRGILVKGGSFLELLNKADTIVLDKTGTVTKGVFETVNVTGDRTKVLALAAAAEQGSLHPIARSIADSAQNAGVPVPDDIRDVKEYAGRGVGAMVGGTAVLCGNAKLLEENGVEFDRSDAAGTVVYVAADSQYIGSIEIADVMKEDSPRAIADLKSAGFRTVMLTGDRRAAAEAVAASAGVDEVVAELLPDGKVSELERIIDENIERKRGKVVFAGDGINDAPALSRADIGIAMGALGSDAAIEAADIVLMNDSLSQIVTAKSIAKKTVRIVTQNIVFALLVKLVVLVLAAFGIAQMWLAVFADVGVAVLAILNSMRCLRVSGERSKREEVRSKRVFERAE